MRCHLMRYLYLYALPITHHLHYDHSKSASHCLFPGTLLCRCVCCHFSCVWLCNSIDCSLPGSSVHGILQARILEWVAMPSSRGSSQPRDQTHISCIAGGFFTAEPLTKPRPLPYFLIISLFLASSLSFTNVTVAADSLCSKAIKALHCLLH